MLSREPLASLTNQSTFGSVFLYCEHRVSQIHIRILAVFKLSYLSTYPKSNLKQTRSSLQATGGKHLCCGCDVKFSVR